MLAWLFLTAELIVFNIQYKEGSYLVKKIQNILFGLSAITGVLFLVGCNEITKEVDKGFVIIGEQTQKWNLETCGTF